MKVLNWIYENIEDSASFLIVIFLMIGIILILAIILGIIGYFLLSVAFPEYVSFGWYWWRFLALGIIMMMA